MFQLIKKNFAKSVALGGLFALMSTNVALAQSSQEKGAASAQEQSHIEMHEKMAKAHEQAAECLKSGKPWTECSTQFREQCREFGGGSGMCGMERGGASAKGMGQGMGMGMGSGSDTTPESKSGSQKRNQ